MDERIRSLERAVSLGEPGAREALAVALRRKEPSEARARLRRELEAELARANGEVRQWKVLRLADLAWLVRFAAGKRVENPLARTVYGPVERLRLEGALAGRRIYHGAYPCRKKGTIGLVSLAPPFVSIGVGEICVKDPRAEAVWPQLAAGAPGLEAWRRGETSGPKPVLALIETALEVSSEALAEARRRFRGRERSRMARLADYYDSAYLHM